MLTNGKKKRKSVLQGKNCVHIVSINFKDTKLIISGRYDWGILGPSVIMNIGIVIKMLE